MTEAIVAAVAYIGEGLAAAGAADLGAAAIMYATEIATAVEVLGTVATMQAVQRRQEGKALDAYNASLRDRYLQIRGATEARQIVLGRCRVSGPWAFFASWGPLKDRFVHLVALAAHEIDAVETVYFNDEPVILDGAGYVTGIRRTEIFPISSASASFTIGGAARAGSVSATARYGSTVTTLGVTVAGTTVSVTGAHPSNLGNCVIVYTPDPCPYTASRTVSGKVSLVSTGSSQTVTLPNTPLAGSVLVTFTLNGSDYQSTTTTVAATVVGANVTFSTSPSPGMPVDINYQYNSAPGRVRVTWHLGSDTQAADTDLVTDLPALWTSNHRLRGTAYLKLEYWYDEESLAGGIPNPSAVVRGAKCYDPRTGTTVWTDNPALCARYYALSPIGGRRSAGGINDTAIIAAANLCDPTVTYVVGGRNYSRKRYTCGYVVKSTTRPDQALDDLCLAMGGDWCIVDNQLLVQAGGWRSPVPLAIDRSWLANHDAQQYRARPARSQMANVYMGTFADEEQDYKVVDWPQVPQTPASDAYVIEDGAQLPKTLEFAAVTFAGQAQYIAACQRRLQRAAVYSMGCNMQAYPLEPFDIVPITEPLFGLADDTFEVVQTRWAPPGGISLATRKVDATIWDMDAGGYAATAVAKASRLTSPLDLPKVTGISISSGASTIQRQADGSGIVGMEVAWTAVTAGPIAQDGQIEIRWGRVDQPETAWHSLLVAGTATKARLAPLQVEVAYLVKLRTVGTLATSDWSAHVTHRVSYASLFLGLVDFDNVSGVNKPANGATVNRLTYSATAPASPLNGDLWGDTSGSPVLIKMRVAGAWQSVGNLSTGALAQLNAVDTAQITAGAATRVANASAAAVSITSAFDIVVGGPGSFDDVLVYTFTPGVSCEVQLTIEGMFSVTTAASGVWEDIAFFSSRLTVNAGIIGPARVAHLQQVIGYSQDASGTISRAHRFAATGGVSYTVKLLGQQGTGNSVCTVNDCNMRIEEIRR